MNIKTFFVADIGGTNARLATVDEFNQLTNIAVYPTQQFENITQVLTNYFQMLNYIPQSGAIALATAITDDFIKLTNNHWAFSLQELKKEFGFSNLLAVNDFTALAMSIPYLPSQELYLLGGESANDFLPKAVLGPGTGLGVSGLIPCGNRYIPIQGEGGHVTMPSYNKRESDIVSFVREKYGHASAERFLSGNGLVEIHDALSFLDKVENVGCIDAPHITRNALNKSCLICCETLKIFIGFLATVAADVVLTLGARGGVYIGGGIIPRITSEMVNSSFRKRFESKGRYENYLKNIPCYIIHSEWPGLIGAYYYLKDSINMATTE